MTPATQAALDVLRERHRQMNDEGWSDAHDDDHADGSIASVAACYAFASTLDDRKRKQGLAVSALALMWPRSWHEQWFKPKDRRQDLVRGAALLIAEIERIDRAAEKQSVAAA